MQHGLLAAYDQSVARVMAALEAHYSLGMIREPVYDFTLAFVAPLGSDDYYILSHIS
jgi:hypothetical protein